MEKPDADGFINVSWPSRNIPHGGIFHTPIANSSTEKQQFLKVLLEESKFSIEQRQKTSWEGALRKEPERKERPRIYIPRVRPHTSRRRSLSAIRESGIYEIDNYRPTKRGENREELKDKLANNMAYGDTPQQIPQPLKTPCILKKVAKLPTAKEVRNNLLTQIRERAEWLAEMEDLGHAGPHRDIIHDQIAERLRDLDALGIESEISSARSSASGFSTLRSREYVAAPDQKSVGSAKGSIKSGLQEKSKTPKKKSDKASARSLAGIMKEENVSAYNNFPVLQCSPRRRV